MAGILARSVPALAGLAAAAALVAALVAGAGAGDPRPAVAQAGLDLRAVGTFDQPVHVAHAPQRPRLVYVVEQAGTIRVVRRGRKLARPFLDIRGRVRSEGNEEGLLSVAFHPRFPRDRRFYVFYVNRAGDLQVDGFRARKQRPARGNPRTRRTVIRVAHPEFSNHNGGQLQFGPGGLLFVGTGDGGGSGDPHRNAQNRRSLLGKLLRIRPRPKGGHRSPRSNPFVGRRGRNQIYSLGLRNPWRFSFDRRSGDLWIGDVGQSRWEEVNHTTRAAARGANFGWNCREGSEDFAGAAPVCERRSGFTEPVHVYPIFGNPECSVVGGYVARGRQAPGALRGRYVYGDHCTGRIRSFEPADPAGTDADAGLTVGFGLSSFGEGGKGRLYVASRSGGVHRIVSR